MTEGSLAKQILLVSLPLMLSNLLQVLFNMSDVAVVGRFAGSTAIGSVGSTSIFVTLFTGFLIGLSNGINVLVARFYGARQEKEVHKTVHSALIVSLLAGVILLLIGLLGSPALLELLNTKEDLLPGAILYLRIYFLGMPALALYNFGNAVFSAIGETKKPLTFLAIAGGVNIALNLFFVIVCQLGVVGDIVLSTDAVQHDMDATVFGYNPGQVPGMKITAFPADQKLLELAKDCCSRVNPEIQTFPGRVVSGDQFVSEAAKKAWLIETFAGSCTEMEGAAIAQAAYLNQIPYLVIRAISDKADDSASMDYEEFEAQAIVNSVRLMEEMVRCYKEA